MLHSQLCGFGMKGQSIIKKTAKENADLDNVDSVSKAINRWDNKGLHKRVANYKRAKITFEIAEHYDYIKKEKEKNEKVN